MDNPFRIGFIGPKTKMHVDDPDGYADFWFLCASDPETDYLDDDTETEGEDQQVGESPTPRSRSRIPAEGMRLQS